MNKVTLILFFFLLSGVTGFSQPVIYPAQPNTGVIFIKNATIHTGNGTVIDNGSIIIDKQKIVKVGSNLAAPAGAHVVDASGKHIYPGLISPITNIGIREVNSGAQGFDDYTEIGEITPSIRSIVAYNTDSKNINVLRTTGILLANVVPQNESGSNQLITGTSTVVQMDAWNWEDAAYKMDGQMHVNMPSLRPRRGRSFSGGGSASDPAKEALADVEKVKAFFRAAKAYNAETVHPETNLNFEATKNLFAKKQKLFVHCSGVKEMLLAIDFAKEFGFDVVIVGGEDSWQIAPLLKENNIAVILPQPHSLPAAYDDDVDQPFKTPAVLQKAGVLFAISDIDRTTRGRNLKYNAGTAAAYGLTKEQALSAITLNTAKILGIDEITGSVEEGKDANLLITEGDILDMEHSIIDTAYIQGRKINLENKQSELAERYYHKYGLK